MKKSKKSKHKRIITIVLTLGFIIPAFCISVFAVSNVGINKIQNNNATSSTGELLNNKNCSQVYREPNAQQLPSSLNSKDMSSNNEKNVIYKSDRMFIGDHADKYILSKDEIENLLKQGFTVKEILQADDIGNSIDVDPKELLAKMKQTNQSLETLENDIIEQQKSQVLNKLKAKYPNDCENMTNAKLNKDDQYSLLVFIDNNKVNSTNQLISDYKTKGKAALDKYINPKSDTVSEARLKQLGITSSDADGVSSITLDKLESASKHTGKTVKELLNNFKTIERQHKGESR